MPRAGNSLKYTIFAIVKGIPKGMTASYAEIAKRAGAPGAHRYVATLMSQNYDSAVPCHRVIYSSGKIGNYNRGGEDKKIQLLKKEGVIIKDNYVHLKN